MQKRELIDHVSAKSGLNKKDSERAMDAIFQTLGELLIQGDRLRVHEFGVFETRTRAPRSARNPRTGESIPLPAATVAAFKPFHALKDRLNAQ